MNKDIRDRLRRLGVHKGAGNLKPAPARLSRPGYEREVLAAAAYERAPRQSGNIAPLWNTEHDTDFGKAFVRRTRYPLDHRHGGWALRDVLDRPVHTLARLNNGVGVDPRNALFLDTETTGLSGGTGTLVFLVGLGYFEKSLDAMDAFVVDQYFLHEPAQEAAMLTALNERVGQGQGLITFNGRGFDVPLLETRFTLSRIVSSLNDQSHLDLLLPARRAWRTELGSCSLGSLEAHMLDVRRDQQDIPGFLIPQLYREYLISRDPAEMQRVMYHNLHDILSMVTLTARLCEAFAQPSHPSEHLAIGREHERSGAWAQAEQAYRSATTQLPQTDAQITSRLAYSLKRQGKVNEALAHWQKLAESNDLEALIELAKYYEWRDVNLDLALQFAQRALQSTQTPPDRQALTHRIQRLKKKAA